MEMVHVNDVELAYERHGNGEQPVVFVHGYMCRATGTMYEELINKINTSAPYPGKFSIYCLDMRGHGGSSHIAKSWSIDDLSEDVVAFCQLMGLENSIYIGHSMGGMLGLLAELKNPGFFKALVLLTPAACCGVEGINREGVDSALKVHRDRKAMNETFSGMFCRGSPEDLEKLVETACLLDPKAHENYLMVEYPRLDIRKHLHKVSPPVLFVNGALDKVVAVGDQHQTAMSVPKSKEVVFSDEGHMLPIEAPQRAASEIIRFYIDEIAGAEIT